MIEYRPCIVCKKVIAGRDTNMKKIVEEHKALFHRWAEHYRTIGESALVGGFSAGQVSQVLGIVEYEDGTCHEVYPYEIQFLDNKVCEFVFPK